VSEVRLTIEKIKIARNPRLVLRTLEEYNTNNGAHIWEFIKDPADENVIILVGRKF
jgi:hypothetical protein